MRRFSLAALAALVFAAAASADDVVVPLTVRSGSLTLSPASTLSRGSRATITVTDARGDGAGWTLLARTDGLSSGMVLVTGVDAVCGRRSTCTLPRTSLRYPILLTPYRQVPVLAARPGTGMGMLSVTLRLGSQAGTRSPAAGGGAALSFAVRPG